MDNHFKYQFMVFIFFYFLSAGLFGADITVTVIDQDLQIPLEGARITAPNGIDLMCDSDGKAVFSVPDDTTAVVNVSYPGYENVRLIIRPGNTDYSVGMRLSGVLTGRELVIEAARPDSSETVSGRSVAVSGRELSRPAETGIVEDVMRAVKLLPGVGYVGGYMAMPSIRGGEPHDITAVFDGFYIEQPFHWGGAFSIFDPKMVESAQLSHGVFSARYGHTISGILDIRAKQPSKEETEFGLSVSTSAANLSLSLPIKRRGGLNFMGRITYYDPFVELAKNFYEEVNYITKAPYIRSTALNFNFNFSTDLTLTANGFFGGDGVAGKVEDSSDTSDFNADVFWDNKLGFITSALIYTPRPDMLLKFRIGAGLLQNDLDGDVYSENRRVTPVSIHQFYMDFTDRTFNLQARADYDWDLGKGFIFSAGLEERYSRWNRSRYNSSFDTNHEEQRIPTEWGLLNHGLASSLYSLVEFKSPNRKFGAEFGIRAEHFVLFGKGFTLNGIPVFNPRINADFNAIEDIGIFDSVSFTVGTGLFSSVNNALYNINSRADIDSSSPTQNRSWTSIAGTKIDLKNGITFTLEGYVKYVFDRLYLEDNIPNLMLNMLSSKYFSDGRAFIWGFDLMLQKFSSRFWDGWITYSYINSKYIDPQSTDRRRNNGDWYYPEFHRFHTLNLIFNLKPTDAFHITTRFSLASGFPIPKTVRIRQVSGPGTMLPMLPVRYERDQVYDDHSRTGVVIPLDIKFTFFSYSKNGKARREIYLNIENLLSVFYMAEGQKGFDSNTGREFDRDFTFASYDLPIPMITFGFKWSY